MTNVTGQLKKLPMSELVKMAEELNVKVAARDTRPRLAKKIRKRQIELAANQESKAQPGPGDPGELPRQSGFEALTQNSERPPFSIQSKDTFDSNTPASTPESGVDDDIPDGRGGSRPGAGRTPGLTDDKARVQRILNNQVPDPNIEFAIKMIFGAWAKKSGITEIALDKDEAELLAVPATNLLEYYLPNFNLSPAIQMWLGVVMAGQMVFSPRLELIRNARAANKSDSGEKGKRKDGQSESPVGVAA